MISSLQNTGERSKTLLARLAEQPKSPAIIGIGEALSAQGRHGEAISRLRAMADFYKDSYRYNLVLARAYRDSGDVARAKEHYEYACEIAPQNEIALRELIMLTAFPEVLSKSLAAVKPPEQTPTPIPKTLTREPEVKTIKLDHTKLSQVLSRSLNKGEKPEPPKVESAPSNTAVVEAFRKADALLNQEADIDALAREMMGNSFLPNPSPAPRKDEFFKPTVQNSNTLEQPTEQDWNVISEQPSSGGVAAPIPPANARLEESNPPHADTSNEPQKLVKIDRNKLTQALSGIYAAKGISATPPMPEINEEQLVPPPNTSMETPKSGVPLSFEEEIMAMQLSGGDFNALLSNPQTGQSEKISTEQPPINSTTNEYDIETIARQMMSASLPKMIETNDPTPVAEQRQPFSDEEEIKMPTRQLAKIFQSQGAYSKAIKVYEMLAEREPDNASLYEILINGLREKM